MNKSICDRCNFHTCYTYTLSPIQNPSKGKVHLSGYGVELAIKNQEYKAKDDTQVQGMITDESLSVVALKKVCII